MIVVLSFHSILKNFQFLAGVGAEKKSEGVNLYPSYVYSGNLRPYNQTPKRDVPLLIPRPDYADHPEGRSMCEEKLRGKLIICS